MGMTKEEIKAYIVRSLGGGIEDVELSPQHLEDIIHDTDRWFSHRVGVKSFRQTQLTAAESVYIMDPDVIEVLRVYLPQTHFPAVDTDDFSYTYSLLFGQWRAPGASPMPYSDLVQRLQYLETASRIFSADRDFTYDPRTRELRIMPAPTILGFAYVEVWSKIVDTRDFLPEDEDLYLRWAVAEGKKLLGLIRTKYANWPDVGGTRALMGQGMIAEGKAEQEQLKRDILNWKRSSPIVIG